MTLAILRSMVEWINRLWQVFLPLGGVSIVIGIQVHTSYNHLPAAIALWVLAGVCFIVGIGGLFWSLGAVRARESEDSKLV